MTDPYLAWRLAEVESRLDALSSFLEACPWPDAADRLSCRELADAARQALAAGKVDTATSHLSGLMGLSQQWRDRPGHPGNGRPGELDRRTRDLVKDVLRQREFPPAFRKQASDLTLSIEVLYRRLMCHPALDRRAWEDVGYLYGRAVMALDLGHFAAATQEILRLEEILEDLSALDGGEAASV